ncbi:hypothetical protein LUZ60_017215 [Juncus effusus]|nr:hypothetical protein LUZ60_017215 [Juncus effusus]
MEKANKRKYPIREADYELLEPIGDGATASVRRALCVPFREIVAIKIVDLEISNADLTKFSQEAKTMILIDHPNLLNAHCSFVAGQELWVVMPFMAGGSCLHIMKSAYPLGFGETFIATVLRDILRGLDYLHQHGHIHRDVKAGNILVDLNLGVKLADFGSSAFLFDSGDAQKFRNTFVGTPCWMAPEVMQQKDYDYKADIWSFGITALELAYGHSPFKSQSPYQILIETLTQAPPSLHNTKEKKFSRYFKQMIAMCLLKDPSGRPSAQKLLKHAFFKQAKSNNKVIKDILDKLPSLEDRFLALKNKEAKLVAEKALIDEQEEISKNKYKTGISNWNFDIEELKAQASMDMDKEANSELADWLSSLFDLDIVHEENDSVQENSTSIKENSVKVQDPKCNNEIVSNQPSDFSNVPISKPTTTGLNGTGNGHHASSQGGQIVKQKGRFTVTSSENIDSEKVAKNQCQ